jgi:RNA polymerase sigma-70 factor (ECF subfamily)
MMRPPEPDPDDEILRLLAAGDLRAIDKLHTYYYQRLFLSVRKFIRDDHDSASLVNDLLINLWDKRDMLGLRKPLVYYLYRSARNRVINFLRDKGRSKEIRTPNEQLSTIAELAGDARADHALLAEDLMLLWRLAEFHMTYRVRQTFVMCRQEGKSKEEIAEAMGITVNAVEKNLARAWRVIQEIRKRYF